MNSYFRIRPDGQFVAILNIKAAQKGVREDDKTNKISTYIEFNIEGDQHTVKDTEDHTLMTYGYERKAQMGGRYGK